MSDTEATLSLVLKARNLASREVDRLHGSFGKLQTGAGRLGSGLQTLAKVGFVGVLGAAAALAGGLAYATKAAAEEQVGIARLDAALRANVKGYSGNTQAIEALIAKREGLAFSDDSLRASLTTLVAKYKDVGRAQDVQAVAMDVARLKGISLEEATVMVSKAMDGNAKILKQLGITDLPKTATEQERLTAVQKVAEGQAEAYGKTAAGAQEAFQIATGDLVEDIGSGLVPIMTQAFTWLRENAIPAVRGVIAAISKWMQENGPLIAQIRDVLSKVIGAVVERLQDVAKWIGGVVNAIASNKDAMNVLSAIFSGIASVATDIVLAIEKVIGAIARIVGAITSNKTIMKGFATVFDTVRAAISGVIDALRTVIGWAETAFGAIGDFLGLGNSTKTRVAVTRGYADGGWVGLRGPELAMVGERGPEYVIPNHQLNAGMGGSGAPVEIVLQLDGRTISRVVDERLYYGLQRAAPTLGRV